MRISVLTMFPQMFDSFLQGPVVQRAVRKGILEIRIVDIKEFAPGSFRHIDDSPFGGGAGMVMRCQPVIDALRSVQESGGKHCQNASEGDKAACAGEEAAEESKDALQGLHAVSAAMTPAGRRFDQKTARRYAGLDHLILICGHYEGMDERIYRHVDEQISLGDYILTGGEIAAMAVSDAVIRLLPGAIRGESTSEESFENGLLEYPQYTRPADYNGQKVPEVLLSGNHEKIRRWRLKESLRKTLELRPDLTEGREFSDEEKELLEEIQKE